MPKDVFVLITKAKLVVVVLLACVISICGMVAAFGETLLSVESIGIKVFIDGEQLICTDVNGEYVSPFIVDGTTYVPIRAISEAFEKNVDWDSLNKRVVISSRFATHDEAVDNFSILNVPAVKVGIKYDDYSFKHAEVDLDGDGIDELLIYDVKYRVGQIYSRVDGIIREVIIPYGPRVEVNILPGNVFMIEWGGGPHSFSNYTTWYSLNNGAFVEIAKEGKEYTNNQIKDYFRVNGEWTDRETYDSTVQDVYKDFGSLQELRDDSEAFLGTMTWTQIE